MAIQSIAARNAPPVIGTVRLGFKVKNSSGSGDHPDNAPHFVLGDAPQVAGVYGDTPKEIDIAFPSDDLDAVVPNWLKLWGAGAKNAEGKPISGKLRCKGNGPAEDGTPGEAIWYEKADPATGIAPARPCLGDKCPDWNDAKGNRACKANMQVFFFMPKVSPFGVFKISTTSWTSIKSFYDQLKWIQQLNQGKIKNILFKLVKEQKAFKYMDHKSGKIVERANWVMLLKPNENKAELEGMRQALHLLEASTMQWSAPIERLEAPIEDVPYIDAGSEIAAAAQEKISAADALLQDPEVLGYFTRIEQLLGAPIAAKDRLITARKHEAKADPKKALLEDLTKQGKALAAKNEKAAPAQVAPPPAQAAPGPDAGGLI